MDQLDPMLLNESTQGGIVPRKQEVELAKSRRGTCFKGEIWKIVQGRAIDTPAPCQYRPVTPQAHGVVPHIPLAHRQQMRRINEYAGNIGLCPYRQRNYPPAKA